MMKGLSLEHVFVYSPECALSLTLYIHWICMQNLKKNQYVKRKMILWTMKRKENFFLPFVQLGQENKWILHHYNKWTSKQNLKNMVSNTFFLLCIHLLMSKWNILKVLEYYNATHSKLASKICEKPVLQKWIKMDCNTCPRYHDNKCI